MVVHSVCAPQNTNSYTHINANELIVYLAHKEETKQVFNEKPHHYSWLDGVKDSAECSQTNYHKLFHKSEWKIILFSSSYQFPETGDFSFSQYSHTIHCTYRCKHCVIHIMFQAMECIS